MSDKNFPTKLLTKYLEQQLKYLEVTIHAVQPMIGKPAKQVWFTSTVPNGNVQKPEFTRDDWREEIDYFDILCWLGEYVDLPDGT